MSEVLGVTPQFMAFYISFIVFYVFCIGISAVYECKNSRESIILMVMRSKCNSVNIIMEDYYGLRVKINDKTFYPEQKGEMKRLKKHLKGSVLEENKIIDK